MSKTLLQQVTPDKPKVLAEERVFVYMPNASSTKKGAASFNEIDFVAPLGDVKLRWPTKMMVDLADPLLRPSLIKVDDDEFKRTGSPVALVHPKTGVVYQSTTAEIKLNRDYRNAFARPELVMLNMDDFEAEQDGNYNKYRIKRLNPMTTPALIQVDQNDFSREAGIVKLNWPMAHNPLAGSSRANGYGMVKIDDTDFGGLRFSADNKLQVRKDVIMSEISDMIVPMITKDAIGLDQVENKAFADYDYDDFGADMKLRFLTEFGKKVDKVDWTAKNNLLDQSVSDLEDEDQSIRDSIASLQLFVGVYPTSVALQAAHPASASLSGSTAFVSVTGTYWALRDDGGWEWYNTLLEDLVFYEWVETDASALRADGVPSVGSSGKWANSDHVHPRDTTKVDLITEIQVVSLEPDTDDFVIKMSQPTVNIPYVRTAQYLHNWKGEIGQANEALWVGTAEEFDEIDPEELPDNILLIVEDDEVYEPGEIVTSEDMLAAGVTMSDEYYMSDDQIVIASKTAIVDGVPLVIRNIPMESSIDKKILEPLDFGDDIVAPDSTHRMAIVIDHENGKTFGKRAFTPSRMMASDQHGNPATTFLNPINMVATSLGDEEVDLVYGRMVIASGNNTIETKSSGPVENRPIVSDGAHGVKTLVLTGSRVLRTNPEGGVRIVDWLEANLVRTHTGTEVTVLDEGKVVISGQANKVEHWVSSGVEDSLVVRGADDGSIKVKTFEYLSRLLITGSDGTLVEIPRGIAGQMLVEGESDSIPGWVDAPLINSSLPQKVLTNNPTAQQASEFQGLVAVILTEAPTEYHNNCIYYIGGVA